MKLRVDLHEYQIEGRLDVHTAPSPCSCDIHAHSPTDSLVDAKLDVGQEMDATRPQFGMEAPRQKGSRLSSDV